MFNNAKSISFRGGEVKQIVRTRDNVIIYQKEEENLFDNYIEIEFSGNTFSTYSSSPFTYTGDIFVDWGDNNELVKYTGGQLSHTYTNSNNYTIKIYGNITGLGDNCFNGTLTSNGLISVAIPNSVTSFGFNCFRGCYDLTSVIIPNSVTTIGAHSFASCINLTSITMSNTITEFKDNLFLGCEKLTSIIIPDSVTTLGIGCFMNCEGLTSIIIPNNVTNIKQSCFYNCTSLTSISIPNSVTNLGSSLFENCINLIEIVLNWSTSDTIKTYNSNWISNTNANLKFLIPPGTTSLYLEKGYPSELLEEENPVSSINFSSTKSIVSPAVGEDECILTGIALDSSNNPVPWIYIDIYKQNTFFESVRTDNNGEFAIPYHSTGEGDVVFKAVCGDSISETIIIEDCLSTNWNEFITSSYASATINNGQLSFSNSTAYYGAYIFNQKPNAPYSIELTYVDTSGGNFVFGLGFVNDNYNGTRNNFIANCYYGKSNNDYWGCLASGSAPRPVTGDVYRLKVYDDHIDTYKNDDLLKTCTPSDSPYTGRFAIIGTDSPRKQTWKDIKIKKIPTPKVDKDDEEELEGE